MRAPSPFTPPPRGTFPPAGPGQHGEAQRAPTVQIFPRGWGTPAASCHAAAGHDAGDTAGAAAALPAARCHANPGCKLLHANLQPVPTNPAGALSSSSRQRSAQLLLPLLLPIQMPVAFGVPSTKSPGDEAQRAPKFLQQPPQLEAGINCRILVGECGKLPRALPGARCQRRLVAAPGTKPWAAGGREQLAAQGGALPTSPRHLLPSATVQPLPGPSRCCLPGGMVQAAPGMGLCHPPSGCRRGFWAQGAAVPWPGAAGGSPKKRGPTAARLPPRSRTERPGAAQPRLSPVPPELPNPAHRARSPAAPVPAGPLAPSARATAGSRRSPVLPGQPPSRLSPVPPGLPVPGIPHASRSLSPTPPGVTTGPPALNAPCSALPRPRYRRC